MQEEKALMIPIDIREFRHPLMMEVQSEASKKKTLELELDQKIGLRKQEVITGYELLRADIDELTNSRDYVEINNRDAYRLFKVTNLRRICFLRNIVEAVVQTAKALWLPALLTTISLLSILLVMMSATAKPESIITARLAFLGVLLSAAAALTAGIFAIACFAQGWVRFSYEFIDVRIEDTYLIDYGHKLPYGVKLKIAEAMDSKLFKDFSVIQPTFTRNRTVFRPMFSIDPAIIGKTHDGREYLICYWDIEADKERVTRDMKRFKKSKLKKEHLHI